MQNSVHGDFFVMHSFRLIRAAVREKPFFGMDFTHYVLFAYCLRQARSTHDAKIFHSLYMLRGYSVTQLSTFYSQCGNSWKIIIARAILY